MGAGMADDGSLASDIRERLIAKPDVILEDRDLMKALIAANEEAMGANIVDLRGIAMQRLEARLDRLEDTHRSVIAAAYENLAGTNQIHRAILAMLDPTDFEDFLRNLGGEVLQILRVDTVRLVLESEIEAEGEAAVERLGDVLSVHPKGFVDAYMAGTRTGSARSVVLRQTGALSESVYGPDAAEIGSEAVLLLNFGPGRLPGMLALGASDPHQFRPNQGTDLLTFLGGVFERAMRRWLS
jgi:uncharacterized protein YigA (DUF484 family)